VDGLCKAITDIDCAMLKVQATPESPIYVNYDHKVAGEATTNPKQRIPPFKDWHQAKCLQAWMELRGGGQPEDPLHIADEYVITDGGKPGLHKELVKIFKGKQHEVTHVTMMYLRDDVQARREKTRQGSVNQVEGQLRVKPFIVEKPVRVGPHYGASSDGNAIGMIRLPAWGSTEALMVTPATKSELFGKDRRWEVGGLGRLEVSELPPPHQSKKVRFDLEDEEPAFLSYA